MVGPLGRCSRHGATGMKKRNWYWIMLMFQLVFHAPAAQGHDVVPEKHPLARTVAASAPVVKPVVRKLPGQSAQLLPVLKTEIETFWPTLAPREFIAGVIDQESNWKAAAALRTDREWGCGLGQFTVAYKADGSVRFDALTETKRLDKSLRDWDWKDCGNVQFQLRATVLKLKVNNRNCSILMVGGREINACNGSQYNGGAGNTAKRIRLCRMDKNCDPTLWYGHLEKQCGQSNVKAHGYGESFCQINSKYPARVEARMVKFQGLLD